MGENERAEDHPDGDHDQPTGTMTLSLGGHSEESFAKGRPEETGDLERLSHEAERKQTRTQPSVAAYPAIFLGLL